MEKPTENEFLNKLVDDHWEYVMGVLLSSIPERDAYELAEIEYHYKTAMKHGWRHAKEYYTGSVE